MKVATAIVNCSALKHNLNRIKEIAPASQIMAIVKGNAYGHGSIGVANRLSQYVDRFGVARLAEAVTLRKSNVKTPIILLEGFFSVNELITASEYQLESVLHSEEQLLALETTPLPHPMKIWMKLDTGMHRLGIRREEAEAFYQRLLQCKNVQQPINFITHLSHSDELSTPEFTISQVALFDEFVGHKPGLQSITASAGILEWPNAHRDLVRPGLILYGISPIEGTTAKSYGLAAVMTLKSMLIAVREHAANESVGYGGEWTSTQKTRLGVVAMGYADGYPQRMRQGTPILINGRIVPLVGRVSMDMLIVDLGEDATDNVGDEVILWGDELPIETVATQGGVSVYELISRMTARVDLEYKE